VWRKAFIFLIVAFQALWMNVLLPGHTRGLITVAGFQEHPAGKAAHACCAADEGAGRKSDRPSKERVANCAICAFAAHLSTPPVVEFAVGPGELLCVLPEPGARSATTPELVLAYMGRGPPRV
jgi:hypothetical protein